MSMRLNESIRSAFVNAVLQDTPKVDDEADPKCKTLPAITDLVTDLVKAGWPDKGKKNAKAKAA